MNQKWDERYKEQEFAYGKAPNLFFKEWLPTFETGNILMPADGEGRNGVFAARLGWRVTSFDLSIEGQSKAFQLAKEYGVSIDYFVSDLDLLIFQKESFDAIGLVYAHFPAARKSDFHKKLSDSLRPGGVIIFEAFSRHHTAYKIANPKVGGPEDVNMLYTTAEILTEFMNYEVLLLEEKEIVLEEGKYHNGLGSVIRFLGRKKS